MRNGEESVYLSLSKLPILHSELPTGNKYLEAACNLIMNQLLMLKMIWQKLPAPKMTIRQIFLADGDAMTLSFRRLEKILKAIKKRFLGALRT